MTGRTDDPPRALRSEMLIHSSLAPTSESGEKTASLHHNHSDDSRCRVTAAHSTERRTTGFQACQIQIPRRAVRILGHSPDGREVSPRECRPRSKGVPTTYSVEYGATTSTSYPQVHHLSATTERPKAHAMPYGARSNGTLTNPR